MTTENILIPRQRYEQLVARMTQKSENVMKQDENEVQQLPRRRILPDNISASQKDFGENTQHDVPKMSDNKIKSDTNKNEGKPSSISVRNNDTMEEKIQEKTNHSDVFRRKNYIRKVKKRSLEDILDNHGTFLPPGRPKNQGELDFDRRKMKKKKSELTTAKKDTDSPKINTGTKKKNGPYSSLYRNWITL